VVAVAIATAGILTAAGYAGYALTQPATVLNSIGCYQTASLDANTAVLARTAESPVAACARVWASAFPDTPQPVSFAACVLPSGVAAVFPADPKGDTCRNLGLPFLAPPPATGTG